MKFHLNRNGSSVTVEGVEPTGELDARDQIPVPAGSGEQIFKSSGISGIPGGSDGVVSGDWVVPDSVLENANGISAGMSSWEFVGDL